MKHEQTTYTVISYSDLDEEFQKLYQIKLFGDLNELTQTEGKRLEFNIDSDWFIDDQLMRFTKNTPLPEEQEEYQSYLDQRTTTRELVEWFLCDMCHKGLLPSGPVLLEFFW